MEKEYNISLNYGEILEIIIALEIRADTMEQLGAYECSELIKELRALIEKIRFEYQELYNKQNELDDVNLDRKLTRDEIIDIMTALSIVVKANFVETRDEVITRLKKLFDLFSKSDVYIGKVRE